MDVQADVPFHRCPFRNSRAPRFLAYYNLERSHQGYRLRGRTPAQALREALGLEDLPPVIPQKEEENEKDAA